VRQRARAIRPARCGRGPAPSGPPGAAEGQRHPARPPGAAEGQHHPARPVQQRARAIRPARCGRGPAPSGPPGAAEGPRHPARPVHGRTATRTEYISDTPTRARQDCANTHCPRCTPPPRTRTSPVPCPSAPPAPPALHAQPSEAASATASPTAIQPSESRVACCFHSSGGQDGHRGGPVRTVLSITEAVLSAARLLRQA
jgi:hypothetical protein